MNKISMQRIFNLFIVWVLMVTSAFAQESEDTLKISLQDAQEFAVEYNTEVKNAQLEVKVADKKVWETTAQGLPQVSASGSYNNNLSLATQLLPAVIFGGPEGEYVEVQFGTQHNFTGTVSVNQLVFSGPYIVGLQAAKVYKSLSKQQSKQTRLDVKANVANTYHLILLSEENKKILKKNLANLEKTLNDSKKMFENGMIEETEVDQVQISVTSLENSIKSVQRQLESFYNLLKIQLGIPLDRPVQLKQSLESVVSNTNLDKTVSEDFSVQNTIGYQLADTQVKLEELDLKRQKANFLPNLSAFYNFNENAMRNEFNFFDFDEEWYQSSILGFQLNIPIFSSGQRYSKVKQAQLQLEKAKNNRELAKKNLKNGYIQARNNYMNAYETYISDQENKELAKKVLDRTNKKYKEGMVTSMELTQANDKYLETQSNYINSLVQLLNAKVQLLKILNAL